MLLPDFNNSGDLPVGVHRATLEEVIARFGTGGAPRQDVTARLLRVYELARATGKVQHFLLFGSYITDKPAPNDVDIVLVMRDDFRVGECEERSLALFDHQRADQEFGVSLFWIRPALLLLETVDEFIAHWQVKRDNTRRGIVEVVP